MYCNHVDSNVLFVNEVSACNSVVDVPVQVLDSSR